LVPISEIIKNNNGEFKIEDDSLNIKFENKDIKVNLKDNTWTNLSKEESEANKFKIDPIIKDDTVYMSLIDFANMFDLKSRWNSKDKLIKLYNNKDMLDVKPYKGKGPQKGIIRFEDVAST
ncbi:polysaccharide deacetylase family protein, partial (plasmid) [Clostridium perfringens]